MSILSTVKEYFADLAIPGEGSQSISATRPLVVGVSGGPDSVALLHVLARRTVFPPEMIVVAHLNHKIRPSAAADASFVKSLAAEWNLSFRTRAEDVTTLAKQSGMSLEAAARQARYAFLAGVAQEFGAQYIVTGHNLNDQAETVLMHILRGSGLAGLSGMRPVSPVPTAPELTLLRPLLRVSRASIEAYCTRFDLKYVVDESNDDITLFRNRIRHELLPALADYNPAFVERLNSLAKSAEADESLLADLLDDYWMGLVVDEDNTFISLDRERWRSLPLAMKRRVLRRGISELLPRPGDIGFETTELARKVADTGATGDQASLPGNMRLIVDYDRLHIVKPGYQPGKSDWPQLAEDGAIPLPVPGTLALSGGWILTAERVEEPDLADISGNPDPWCAYISATLTGQLQVRPHQVGERLQPLGLDGRSAKIGDIMTNRKVPAALRSRWPILACRDHALWIVGHVTDERARLDPGDRAAILVRAERLGPSQ